MKFRDRVECLREMTKSGNDIEVTRITLTCVGVEDLRRLLDFHDKTVAFLTDQSLTGHLCLGNPCTQSPCRAQLLIDLLDKEVE